MKRVIYDAGGGENPPKTKTKAATELVVGGKAPSQTKTRAKPNSKAAKEAGKATKTRAKAAGPKGEVVGDDVALLCWVMMLL